MRVDFLKSGFEFVYDEDKYFVPFDSIDYIGPVKVNDESIDFLTRSYVCDTLVKRAYFDVYIKGRKKPLSVYLDECNTLARKKINSIKKLFGLFIGDDLLLEEERNWLKDNDNMKKYIDDLNDCRTKIIHALEKSEKSM